jgi:hypothetical protein
LAKVLFVCLAVFYSIQLLQHALPDYLPKDWSAAHEGDALTDWKAARLYHLDVTPYSQLGLNLMKEGFTGHPPTTPFWYLPLAGFSKPLVAEISTLLLWFLLIPHIYLCAKELKWPIPGAVTALGCALVLSTTWGVYHFNVIQFSEPMAFLYLIGWLCLRRGWDGAAGISLGAAATIKLFPGLMLVFLLLARRWRAFFAGAAVYLSVAAFMTRAFGLDSWLFFFRQQEGIANAWIANPQNSSLYGLVTRILYPFCETVAHPSKTATYTSLAGSLLLLAIAVWACRNHLRCARETDLRAIDLPYALFSVLSVFLNAWVWEHYYVFAIQPFFILATVYGKTWQTTLREWCDGIARSGSLVLGNLLTLVGLAGLALVLYALDADHWLRGQLIGQWQAGRDPYIHRLGHFMEAINFLPWLVPIVLCVIALRLRPLRLLRD